MLARARVVDVALAGLSAALTVLAIVGVTFAQGGPVSGSRWWTLPLLLVPAAALLVRRTSPVVCVVGVWVPIALHAALTGVAAEGLFLVVPGWVSLYALAAYGSRRQLVAGLGVAVICLVVHDLFDPAAWRSGGAAAWSAAFWTLLLFVPALLGGWVAGTRRARRLAADNAALERRRQDEARAAVQEERARVARELHDAVTHNINIVVLQAMAASGVLDDNPDRVREPLTVIEHRAREALEEMRRMLGVLRDADGEPDTETPAAAQGVDDLDLLLGGAADAGLTVEITTEGQRRRLPAALGLTLYRIVQEALSNAARHAAGSRVSVRVRYEPEAVDLAIIDDGGDHAATSLSAPDKGQWSEGAGLGLVGMRERVAAFGGMLEAGPHASGGFGVHARLPLRGEAVT